MLNVPRIRLMNLSGDVEVRGPLENEGVVEVVMVVVVVVVV